MRKTNLNLLENPKVIQWCFKGVTDISLKNTESEKKLKESKVIEQNWGNEVIKTIGGKQWTTVLCQDLVMEALIKLGRKNVRTTTAKKSSIRDKKYDPDLECDDFVYEVKGRSWSTPGTAGEKILGVPLKYGELPRLYNKPLQIILVGYQEYEAREKFAFGDLLDKNNQTIELQESLAFYKEKHIEYVAFTDILKKLNLGKEYWDKKDIKSLTKEKIVSPYTKEIVMVPLVGSVPCGTPLCAEQNIEEMISVPKERIKSGANYFILRASGDSMNKAGINDGDLILCLQKLTAHENDRVVALIGDEVTVKEFHREGEVIILKPCSTNQKYKPIHLTEGIQIQGIVQGVVERI